MLSSLIHFCLPITESKETPISLELLSWISKLPILESLDARRWNTKKLGAISHTFQTIRTLFLRGRVTTRSVIKLVNACPNLSELRLYNGSRKPVTDYARILPHVQPRIQRLDLGSFSFFPLSQDASANYSQLRYLRLSTEIFPDNLHLPLCTLTELEELALDSGTEMIPTQELLKVVDGSRRLPKLRKLSLDVADGSIGQRVNPFSPEGIEVIESQEYERWIGDYSDEGEWFTGPVMKQGHEEWSKCERLLAAAKENGVLVTGGLLKGLETLHAHLIEVNNLSIVRAYYHSNFHTVPYARQLALDHRFPLPELDIDSIDPKKLELVKVEMEEYGWFALSLRNKEWGGRRGVGSASARNEAKLYRKES
ncbi:hypothetical protein JCM5353_003716 [Sporobolomyces roseus]